jgi:hypothetical protein
VWLNSTTTKWFQALLRCREINGLRNDFEKRPRDKTKFYSKLSILKNICPTCSFKIEIESPLKKQTF